jgi:hypothetical protein
VLLLVEEYFRLRSWRLLGPEDDPRFLSDVLVQKLGVAGNRQLALNAVVVPQTVPVWNKTQHVRHCHVIERLYTGFEVAVAFIGHLTGNNYDNLYGRSL